MHIHNENLRKIVEEKSKIAFTDENHIKDFEKKSAPFLDHCVPRALRMNHVEGEVWLKQDLQLMIERPILSASIHGELIRLMGFDGAYAVLYEAAYKYGYEDAKQYLDYVSKSLKQPEADFNDIFYASLGWGVWQTISIDLENARLHLRNWNRADVKKFKEIYGKQDECVCFVLQGFNAGICTTLFQRKMRTIEVKCVAKGDDYCEFFSMPEDQFGSQTVDDALKISLNDLKMVPGVLAAAVVSRDGKIMASAFRSDIKQDDVATMTATIFSVAKQAASELKLGDFNNIFVDSKEGYLALTNIGTDAVLVALTSKKIPIGSIMLKLKKSAQDILAKKLL